MGRSPCCSKEGLNRGAWTAIEDKILTDYIKENGEGKWRNIPKKSGLKRCGKSCRLRWLNYLRPDIKRGNITQDEEDLIIRLHKLLGNRWSLIAGRLPGRTDNEIKNYWNSNLSKKAQGNQSNNFKIHKELISRQFDEDPSQGVIQAKAVRCTEALFIQQHHKIVNLDTNVTMAPSMDTNLVKNVVEKSECSEGSLSLSSIEENSSEFMMDFNVGKTSLLEILDSDFSKLCDFGICDMNNVMQGDGTNNGCKAHLQHFSGQAFLLPEEMVVNWSGSDCVQANMDSDFGAFASFLESAEEWMI